MRPRWYREPGEGGRHDPMRPRAVVGGIKADLRGRAPFKSFWARRWIEVLRDFGQGARIIRGRSYARLGQVRAIAIAPGRITASVQGSQPDAYAVAIELPVIAPEKWRAVVQGLSVQLQSAARLLAGEACADLEAAFRAAQANLLPERARDLVTTCNCADGGDPCKHVAAVHCIFGAELERDPFLLFTFRGIDRDELLHALTGEAAAPPAAEPDAGEPPLAVDDLATTDFSFEPGAAGTSDAPPRDPPEPLPADPDRFFHAGPLPPLDLLKLRMPALAAGHLRPLGNLPFWRGKESLVDALAPIYRAASILAIALCLGEDFDQLVDPQTKPDPRGPQRPR